MTNSESGNNRQGTGVRGQGSGNGEQWKRGGRQGTAVRGRGRVGGKALRVLFFVLCLLLSPRPSSLYPEDVILIKFATLAPEGSTWMNIMQEWNKDLAEKSGGRLRFKIYPGGIAGDEKDVVRKIRLGQLHAGGFTGVGLGEIAPEARILDAPFLFRNTDEVDFISKTFEKDFLDAFRNNGYVFLGWAEVGFVYIFTGKPIGNLRDLKNVKMWMWEGDPIAEAAFKSLGVSPIPLSIADVNTSLQTGLIDGVYSSPLAAIALQWFTRAKFMYDYQLANASGAVLISKTFFDKLPKDLQDILVSTGRYHMNRLTIAGRKDNRLAVDALKKNGLKISAPPSAESAAEYAADGQKARQMLAGRLYSLEFLKKVESALDEYRIKKKP